MTILSRREWFRFGAGASMAALLPAMISPGKSAAERFSTGVPELDAALGGGLRGGTLTVVIGPEKSGKTAFLSRLAKANGILETSHVGQERCDMLSIMRHNGQVFGHLMSDGHEPITDVERQAMAVDPAARHAFLYRWFVRSHEVLQESGGIFVFSVLGTYDAAPNPNWLDLPEYVISLDGSGWQARKS